MSSFYLLQKTKLTFLMEFKQGNPDNNDSISRGTYLLLIFQ